MKTEMDTLTVEVLDEELLQKIDAYWRAANYLSVGQIYLYDNPLLKRPLALTDVKHMLLGHWGTTPGQNFIYAHLNRVITKYDLDMIYVSGPGHGGPAVVGNTYLEGTYSEIYPDISQDEAGLRRLFVQFSFPGGIPSHASPECPGSIHEGDCVGVPMPPPRPYWKGYIKLALVSCPIALYTASSSSERVAFRQINKKTGNRVRQKLVDEVTREPVEGEDKGRGYEYSKGAYIEVDDDELDAVAVESNHTIEIDSFVPRSQIDERYLDSPYYIIS